MASDEEDAELIALRNAVLASMKAKTAPKKPPIATEELEDEAELAALRAAALRSKKTIAEKNAKQVPAPISTIPTPPVASMPLAPPPIPRHVPHPRFPLPPPMMGHAGGRSSNLIVIQTTPLPGEEPPPKPPVAPPVGDKGPPPPKFAVALPQDKWAGSPSSNQQAVATPPKPKANTKFSRFESSDSEDEDEMSSSSSSSSESDSDSDSGSKSSGSGSSSSRSSSRASSRSQSPASQPASPEPEDTGQTPNDVDMGLAGKQVKVEGSGETEAKPDASAGGDAEIADKASTPDVEIIGSDGPQGDAEAREAERKRQLRQNSLAMSFKKELKERQHGRDDDHRDRAKREEDYRRGNIRDRIGHRPLDSRRDERRGLNDRLGHRDDRRPRLRDEADRPRVPRTRLLEPELVEDKTLEARRRKFAENAEVTLSVEKKISLKDVFKKDLEAKVKTKDNIAPGRKLSGGNDSDISSNLSLSEDEGEGEKDASWRYSHAGGPGRGTERPATHGGQERNRADLDKEKTVHDRQAKTNSMLDRDRRTDNSRRSPNHSRQKPHSHSGRAIFKEQENNHKSNDGHISRGREERNKSGDSRSRHKSDEHKPREISKRKSGESEESKKSDIQNRLSAIAGVGDRHSQDKKLDNGDRRGEHRNSQKLHIVPPSKSQWDTSSDEEKDDSKKRPAVKSFLRVVKAGSPEHQSRDLRRRLGSPNRSRQSPGRNRSAENKRAINMLELPVVTKAKKKKKRRRSSSENLTVEASQDARNIVSTDKSHLSDNGDASPTMHGGDEEGRTSPLIQVIIGKDSLKRKKKKKEKKSKSSMLGRLGEPVQRRVNISTGSPDLKVTRKVVASNESDEEENGNKVNIKDRLEIRTSVKDRLDVKPSISERLGRKHKDHSRKHAGSSVRIVHAEIHPTDRHASDSEDSPTHHPSVAKRSRPNSIWSRHGRQSQEDIRSRSRERHRDGDKKAKPEPISIWTSKRVIDSREKEKDQPPKPAKVARQDSNGLKEKPQDKAKEHDQSSATEAKLDEHIVNMRQRNLERMRRAQLVEEDKKKYGGR